MSKLMWTILFAVAVVGIAWVVVKQSRGSAPAGPDQSVEYPILNREHIEVGDEFGAYNSNPPSSGLHYELTSRKGFHEEPVPDQYVIHNLEHGDVWIAYHPRMSEDAKDALRKFGFSKIIITPREANETDIALVAWGRVDAFDLEDGSLPEERIRDFIKRYRNKGPEKMPAGAKEATFN